MHGLVLLDAEDKLLRESIIWCDNRAVEEAEDLRRSFGDERMKNITGKPNLPAYKHAKLLWVK